MTSPSKAVLITGCSTGIGAETARHLAQNDWTVYATARKPETLQPLEAAGCKTLALDVTDETSMNAAVAHVTEAEGAVGVLINNAGYSQSGAVESIELDSIRRQFETNVFGLIRMSQLCLPGMRDQGWGRIVNIGSMGGKLTFPGGGIYHATKYSVEAISDAMRFETRGFGVNVVLIEPGLIVTEFANAAAVASLDDGVTDERPIRQVQPSRRQDDRRRLRGPAGEARRRPRRGREGDRQGDLRQAPAPPLHRDAVREALDRSAPAGHGSHLGPHHAHAISDARLLSEALPITSLFLTLCQFSGTVRRDAHGSVWSDRGMGN